MDSVPGEVELALGVAGHGSPPILALHGITSQHRSFNALAAQLSEHRRVAAPDLRGRGDSEKPNAGEYGLQAHAADMIRVMDHLGRRRAVLAGHSMGGFVALRAALDYPERVRGLVLLDGGRPRQEEDVREEDLEKGLERAFSRLGMSFASVEEYLDFWYPGQNLTLEMLPIELADYYLYDLVKRDGIYRPKASYDAAVEDAGSIVQGPTAEEMKAIECPVALVRAEQGLLVGSAPLIPDATRDRMAEVLDLRSDLLLDGANHYSMMFEPYAGQIVRLVDGFLRNL